MQLGGLMGDLIIAGPAIAHFWPVLWVGQWTHVGKGTSFGLGAYRLEEA
jgi:CRISPR/Cas system endoribonuclease Cas6 (RAMP superfamily)